MPKELGLRNQPLGENDETRYLRAEIILVRPDSENGGSDPARVETGEIGEREEVNRSAIDKRTQCQVGHHTSHAALGDEHSEEILLDQ